MFCHVAVVMIVILVVPVSLLTVFNYPKALFFDAACTLLEVKLAYCTADRCRVSKYQSSSFILSQIFTAIYSYNNLHITFMKQYYFNESDRPMWQEARKSLYYGRRDSDAMVKHSIF